jgi:hypothetical protein
MVARIGYGIRLHVVPGWALVCLSVVLVREDVASLAAEVF